MIYNILILLIANVFIPFVPLPPEIFLAANIIQYQYKQATIYDSMNLTRLYEPQNFKKYFRDSMKRLHPDKGGNQQDFAKIKGMKEIMQQSINYYDLYNLTTIDLAYNQSFKEVVQMKQMMYLFEYSIFYFIAMLYILAFTIDETLKPSRKWLLPLTVLFAIYEWYIFITPWEPTIIDLAINDKIPLFIQSSILRKLFCILSAIIRTRYFRRSNQQKVLLNKLNEKPQKQQQYTQILTQLQNIYTIRLQKAKKDQASWITKIRDYLSKGLSFLIIGLIIYGMVAPGSQQEHSEF